MDTKLCSWWEKWKKERGYLCTILVVMIIIAKLCVMNLMEAPYKFMLIFVDYILATLLIAFLYWIIFPVVGTILLTCGGVLLALVTNKPGVRDYPISFKDGIQGFYLSYTILIVIVGIVFFLMSPTKLISIFFGIPWPW